MLNAPELVNDDEENLGQFTKLYDDYPSAQSSLRTYIYDTLSTEKMVQDILLLLVTMETIISFHLNLRIITKISKHM